MNRPALPRTAAQRDTCVSLPLPRSSPLRLAGLATLLMVGCAQVPPLAGAESGRPAAVSVGQAVTASAAVLPIAEPPAGGKVSIPARTTEPAQQAAGVVVPASDAVAPTASWPRGLTRDLYEAPDTWGRLRRGFKMAPLAHPLADQHARRFASTSFLEQRADRLRLYLPIIVAEIDKRGMPLELALLPLVESALNPHARSPVGALGTWQFMQPTGERFGLRSSRLVDDRKNLIAATGAAMDYLGKLHAQFNDWHLALAAYNWGEGRVQRAVNRQRERGEPADFNALAAGMPAETRNYVPQLEALRRLVDNPSAWLASLPELPDGHPLEEVALQADIDLRLVLQMSGLRERDFLALNPAVKPPLVLAHATPHLLMPDDAARRFIQALARHEGPMARWSVLKLTSTQPVEVIASRHGTSAASLREVNGIPRGTKPVAGSVLLLPVAQAPGQAADADTVATARLSIAPDLVRVTLKAQPRETWRALARRTGFTLHDLVRWNGLSGPRAGTQRVKHGAPVVAWVLRDQARRFGASG